MRSFKITNKGSGYIVFNISGKNVTISPQTTVTVDVQEKDEHVIESLKRSLIIGPNLVIEEIHSTSIEEDNQQVHNEVKAEQQLTETEETVQKAEVVEKTNETENVVKIEEAYPTTTEIKTNTPQKRRGGRPRKVNPQGA
jgi:hypothetical protein